MDEDKLIPDTFYKGHEQFTVKYRFDDGTQRIIAVRTDYPQGPAVLMKEDVDVEFITESPVSYVGIKPNGVATSYTSLEGQEGAALDEKEKNSMVIKVTPNDNNSFDLETIKNDSISLKEFYYGDLQQQAQGEA